ncbi:hypothetical protein PN419_00255 [Halorubrum ezzemoulense]|uniref:hypothetical protein n=1 Tax=Halorubrum ezzemoulense TaxID=337243 RepID=UPI00232C32E6|nr:hypothetical protein [Halorubrum ezzemoulense]MDB9247438.1 hypothetical protein [Halorubrum ezzemoulense]MDB9258653.1 hypothetical protein [Halorubrum ezzemoulense]MDB9264489.1 hypothetical protein [Halorubrum ezzemoulense]MDB9269014.1 hypothetical protein [Halorubrum ezzemoulense]MDB9271457.1 hypothetical protein [Halorubrum ezzemoulense]
MADRLSSVLPYTAYAVDEAEYLGSYDADADATAEMLRDQGYHYQLFAAEKRRGEDGPTDEGSYARIPEEHPEAATGTALAETTPRECQYHVHLFERVDPDTQRVVTDLYGHYEIHPYPHTPTWDLTRPWPRHYRPTWDTPDNPRDEWTYLRGVRDPRLDRVLNY